eukprot:6937865-Alexandrium_andersonii.AAC.1
MEGQRAEAVSAVVQARAHTCCTARRWSQSRSSPRCGSGSAAGGSPAGRRSAGRRSAGRRSAGRWSAGR